MIPHKGNKSIATLIVGALDAKKKSSDELPVEDKNYNDKAVCLEEAFKAMQEGDFEKASMHLMDWKFLANEEESENSHGYSEKEV